VDRWVVSCLGNNPNLREDTPTGLSNLYEYYHRFSLISSTCHMDSKVNLDLNGPSFFKLSLIMEKIEEKI
jgi:hypothetical protein